MLRLLFCVVLGVASGQSQSMDELTRGLQDEMQDVWEQSAVNYSEPVINATYRATVEFDMRAMGPLYNSTHMVIDVIANKQAYPEGFVSVHDGHVELKSPRQEWKPLLAHYAGPTAVIVIAVLLVAILPLSGLFWCCCYWCRVGRRRRPFDRKYDACLKGMLAIVLIALLTLFLFGVVCLFATDSQVESGAREAPESLRVGLRDARAFLNATQAHARYLLVDNYRELSTTLEHVLSSSGMVVSTKLSEFSRAVSVTTLSHMVQKLDVVREDLHKVKELTTRLRNNAEHLNSVLNKVKSNLLHTLKECQVQKCKSLQEKWKIGELGTEIHYSQMPDVSDLLSNVTALMNSNIKEEVAAGQQVFRNIQRDVRVSVQRHIPSVKQALDDTGKKLERMADEITWRAGNASAALERHAEAADSLQELFAQYGPYRRYAGLAAAIAPLLITCLMAWGLVCGVCGKRPDVYGASDCCNKGAGSRCLLCGIGVIFAVGGVMALVLVAYFTVGVASQRFICDPLTEPRGNRLFNDVDVFVDLEYEMFHNRSQPAFNLTAAMVACHDNRTLYEGLHLNRLFNIEEYRMEISRSVSGRVANLRPSIPRAEPILRDSAKVKLAQLAASGLSDFDFDKILDALETNITSLPLDQLAAQLNSTASSLPADKFPGERRALLQSSRDLTALLTDTLQPMLADTAELNMTGTKLRDEMRFNHSSLKEAISYLMHEATEADAFLSTQGPARLQNMTRRFAAVIEIRLNEYLDRVEHAAQQDVGRCGPISNAFNATRDAVCNKILMPTNGYWMSLAWCVLLFLPLLLVAQRLARLYLHLDPYPGPLVEAEYLYDAYADRDNVPLANAYKVEKRGGGRARAREVEHAAHGPPRGHAPPGGPAGGAAGGAAARDSAEVLPTSLDAHHARRYNDMAPKHWEEGPPRYHGPTEYERPPPYYYPGPNDRQ